MFFLCRLMKLKGFFNANYFNCSLTSPVIHVLDTHAAVEPRYNHTIWQKSWTTIIVGQYSAQCFSLDFASDCLQRRKKSLWVFVLDTKTKEDDKIVLQRVGFKIGRERQRLLLQSRKKTKRWQSSWKTHWKYHEIEFHEFLSEQSELFRPQSGQASDKVAQGSMPYKKQTKDCFESLLFLFFKRKLLMSSI